MINCLRGEISILVLQQDPEFLGLSGVYGHASSGKAVGMSVSVGPPLWPKVKYLNISTFRWTAKTFWTDIHGSLRVNPSDFVDPLTFPLAPP